MIKIPSKATLAKYGLTADTFLARWESQGSVCPICRKVPTTGRTNIDHFHTKGWKKLPPERRAQFVRGILCWWCNKNFVTRGITIEKSRNVTAYLERFEAQVNGELDTEFGFEVDNPHGAEKLPDGNRTAGRSDLIGGCRRPCPWGR